MIFHKLIKKSKNEQGFASAILLIALIPIVFAMVGFSFDFARAGYIKSQLTGAADTALQTTANIGYIDNGRINIGKPNDSGYAQRESIKLYCTNGPRFGNCGDTTTISIIGSPLSLSDLCRPLSAVRYGISLRSIETIPTIFLGIIGQDTITLVIESAAMVRPRTC
jgi:hypothetical protein